MCHNNEQLKRKTMKKLDANKVIEMMVKRGNNRKEVIEMVNTHIAYVQETYKGVTVKQAAEIISALSAM